MGVSIDALLRELVDKDASDLHLKCGEPPIMRIRGDLHRANYPILGEEDHRNLLFSILNDERREKPEPAAVGPATARPADVCRGRDRQMAQYIAPSCRSTAQSRAGQDGAAALWRRKQATAR